ncbi:MAG: hypothetical protein DWQ34_01640 [Planctomycetota bacterium]|nr:MAG: hypothetical protein DWQ29_05655 [Planctomycetota bacterium]REJ97650.1 MAG: hypothetical protein DWQ34_01640 [Planctomycetota bacterium]REK19918.1 MAG: hypothetical protein DWQ41_26680 [Planctomycetota bacterium]REK27483.1 MAG: hypothetical protein DWQ45_25695 [Planctomycetota bacterium]
MHQDGRHASRFGRESRIRPALAGASLTAAFCLMPASLGAVAEENAPYPVQNGAATENGETRYLVLFDGRVMQGRITERPGGYMLDSQRGRMVIPHDFIRLTAVSLEEAYQKQRDNMTKPGAGDHIALARWCNANRLYIEAEEQLTAALKLEPQRSEARQLLKRVVQAAAEAEERSWKNSGFDTIEARPGRSAPGISNEATEEFARRVQPLLVNKCGNATCHGRASSNTFRLENVKAGSRHQRLESDRNLRNILAQLNLDSPYSSPLLRKPQDNESLVHRGIFFGPRGEDQRKILNDWVELVASQQSESPVAPQTPSQPTPEPSSSEVEDGQVIQVGATQPQARKASPLTIEIPRTPQRRETVSSSNPIPAPKDDALIQRVLDEDRPDAFDPDVFNRKVHGNRNEDRR